MQVASMPINTITAQHTYSLLGVTGTKSGIPPAWTTKYVVLRNPHGKGKGDPVMPGYLYAGSWYNNVILGENDGVFALSSRSVCEIFYGVCVDSVLSKYRNDICVENGMTAERVAIQLPFSFVFCACVVLVFLIVVFPVSAILNGTETLITTDTYKTLTYPPAIYGDRISLVHTGYC